LKTRNTDFGLGDSFCGILNGSFVHVAVEGFLIFLRETVENNFFVFKPDIKGCDNKDCGVRGIFPTEN
jgi:hypothetical protein